MNNPHKMRTGMDRVLHAFGYSMQGLRAALRFESAFRQEAALALVLLPAAFWLGRNWIEVALLAGSVLTNIILVERFFALRRHRFDPRCDPVGKPHRKGAR